MSAPHIVTVFNNKGGVGKTTLTYHLAQALGEIGKKVLLIDLDPQCSLTIFAMQMEAIHDVWVKEDNFIEDFDAQRSKISGSEFEELLRDTRSIHFLLKPTEDGTAELGNPSPPVWLSDKVALIPGRLTLHLFEAKVGERWSGIYQGDPLSIRTATRVRSLAHDFSKLYGFDIVILDTSPSLGALNRNLLSLADGFIIPCAPDLFSVYGIRNIGNALETWQKQFDSIFHFLSDAKRDQFPKRFVRFMGYTLYNAKKYRGAENPLGIARAHYNYAQQIPLTIQNSIDSRNMINYPGGVLEGSIGENSVIYTHNTFPSMSQKYNRPMWQLPSEISLEPADKSTISGNSAKYEETQVLYQTFAQDFLARVECLNG